MSSRLDLTIALRLLKDQERAADTARETIFGAIRLIAQTYAQSLHALGTLPVRLDEYVYDPYMHGTNHYIYTLSHQRAQVAYDGKIVGLTYREHHLVDFIQWSTQLETIGSEQKEVLGRAEEIRQVQCASDLEELFCDLREAYRTHQLEIPTLSSLS